VGQTPDSENDFSETTRDLRRALFLSETLELVIIELEEAAKHAHRDQQTRAVVHRWLEQAWNDGARKEADLRAAVSVLRSQVDALKAQLRDALRRISLSRVEPEPEPKPEGE
jgi:hypothetical protein